MQNEKIRLETPQMDEKRYPSPETFPKTVNRQSDISYFFSPAIFLKDSASAVNKHDIIFSEIIFQVSQDREGSSTRSVVMNQVAYSFEHAITIRPRGPFRIF
jgi:hypothetical protein